MRISKLIVLATLLSAACGSPEPVDPAKTPDGRLCQRAYSSLVDSYTDVFTQKGVPEPDTWPDKAAYIDKCLAVGFSEPQLKCLDPKISGSDPAGCKETLEPVKSKHEELMKWFSGELEKVLKKEAEKPDDKGEETTDK